QGIAARDSADADLDLQHRDRREIQVRRRTARDPRSHARIGPPGRLAQLADDVGVEQVTHSSGTRRSMREGSNSMSRSSSMLSRSTRDSRRSPIRLYSSIDRSTYAGSPRSVI